MSSPSLDMLTGFRRKLVVGVGGLAVSNNRNVILATYSLGSCLGITIYDPVARAGGMLHAMLPDSGLNPAKAAGQPAMFIDTGLAALLEAAHQFHVAEPRMRVCVAGGAQIMDQSGFFNIGQRNYQALKKALLTYRLTLDAEAVGGLVSRTLSLELETGQVRLKTSGQVGEAILFAG